jgi:hypothetical protein
LHFVQLRSARTEFFLIQLPQLFFLIRRLLPPEMKEEPESESVHSSHGYVPWNLRSPKERKDLYDVVMADAVRQRDDELKAQYLQHDKSAPYWPLTVNSAER